MYSNPYFTDTSTLSITEEFVDSILYVPVEMKRYLALMRELDSGCEKDTQELEILQEKYLSYSQGEQWVEDKALFEKISALRASLMQKIDEKRSIADQLYEMIDEHISKATIDITTLENILKVSGVLDPGGIQVGKLVAACTTASAAIGGTAAGATGSAGGAGASSMDVDAMGSSAGNEALWILCRVVSYSSSSEKCTVADVENDSNTYVLPTKNIVVLPDEGEDVQSARDRLPQKGKPAMAIYPNTTSFYECVIVTPPYRATAADGEQFKDRTVVTVEFQDDEDAVTGLPPKRVIPTVCVFARPGTAKKRRMGL